MPNTYLHMKTEHDLANLQQLQIGNSCSFHAISTAIKLLLDIQMDPHLLAEEIDYLWWRFKPMRTYPGWAVTPNQQKRIVNYLAESRGFPIEATFEHAPVERLWEVLNYAHAVPLVTILWLKNKAPGIYLGSSPINHNNNQQANAHTMLLAAFDAMHITYGVGETPWGFINSWRNGGENLFWMRDEDFRRTWDFFLPSVGPRPLVLIEQTE